MRSACARAPTPRRPCGAWATTCSRWTSTSTWCGRCAASGPEAAFIALHGKGGEDGTVQELLEILEIPYTGPGVLACERAGTRSWPRPTSPPPACPPRRAYAFSQDAFRELGAGEAIPDIRERLGLPLVVKPAKQGSALGITVARDAGRRARRR